MRNHYSEEEPIMEAAGAVLVNPNTFSRVKMVFDYILEKSGTIVKPEERHQVKRTSPVGLMMKSPTKTINLPLRLRVSLALPFGYITQQPEQTTLLLQSLPLQSLLLSFI